RHATSRVLICVSSLVFFRPPPRSPLFPYTTLFRSAQPAPKASAHPGEGPAGHSPVRGARRPRRRSLSVHPPPDRGGHGGGVLHRSEEHTSELQSRFDLVCRLLLEKINRCCSRGCAL